MTVQVSETVSVPSPRGMMALCSATRTGSRSPSFPDGAFSQLMRDPSGSQPRSGPSSKSRLMPSFMRAMTCPPAWRIAMIRSWPGKLRSKQVTRPANRSGRRFTSRFSRVCSPALACPVIAPSMARPARLASATIFSCGNGAAPSPSSAAVPVQPKNARFAGVSARFTSIPSAASTIMPGQQHR